MRMHNTTLSNEQIDLLQDLIRANIDSCEGYREAAEKVDDPDLAHCFKKLAHDREQQSHELQAIVAVNAEQPCETGSSESGQRAPADLHSAIASGVEAVLAEAERAEYILRDQYEEARREAEGTPVGELLERHYRSVCEAHDEVKRRRGV